MSGAKCSPSGPWSRIIGVKTSLLFYLKRPYNTTQPLFCFRFFCFEAEANKCSYQLRSSSRVEISKVQAPERKALRCYDAISSLFSQIMNPFCFQAGTTVGQQLITLCKASSRRPSALTKQQTAGQQRQPSNRSPGQLLTPALQTPPLA